MSTATTAKEEHDDETNRNKSDSRSGSRGGGGKNPALAPLESSSSSSSSSDNNRQQQQGIKRLRDDDVEVGGGGAPQGEKATAPTKKAAVKREDKDDDQEEEEKGKASAPAAGTTTVQGNSSNNNNTGSKPLRAPWWHAEIPSTAHYHCSWMHADVVTHCVHAAAHGVVLTASRDGVVKFWKRQSMDGHNNNNNNRKNGNNANNNSNNDNDGNEPLEFVKAVTAHAVPIVLLAVSFDQNMAATVDASGNVQFYHIALFDAPSRLTLSQRWPPQTGVWVQAGVDRSQLLVVSTHNGPMHVVSPDGNGGNNNGSNSGNGGVLQTLWVHGEDTTVSALVYNPVHSCVFSGDTRGMLQMWDTHGDYVTVQPNRPNNQQQQQLRRAHLNNRNAVTTTADLDVAAAAAATTTTTIHIGASVTARRNDVTFSSRLETQLLHMFQKETYATAMAVSPDGSHYAVYGKDLRLRLFVHETGQLLCTYDERLKIYDKQYNGKPYHLDALEYGRRAALEREMQGNRNADPALQQSVQLQFESTEGKYILLPTMMGIKVIDWQRHKLVKIVGTADATQHRFLALLQCPGSAQEDTQLRLARRQQQTQPAAQSEHQGDKPKQRITDALLIAWAYKSRRFFVFSHVDPAESLNEDNNNNNGETNNVDNDRLVRRDHWNEQPDAQDAAGALVRGGGGGQAAGGGHKLATQAVLHTTLGDIHVQLFAQQTPKTVENFGTHAKNGYYDGLLFHRVIKGFMLQTGDPNGDGTGGESIWGGEFADEIVAGLRHDRPFTLSMANAGANTNGSQFFITTVPCPWLDGKHTVFGRVQRGMDVCTLIENVKTDDGDKPLKEVQIINIDIL